MRKPDRYIGGEEDPYLLRWYLIPRNSYFNIYYHKFLKSDDARALHDHPWWSISIALSGILYEHEIDGSIRVIQRGRIRFRRATYAHRLELISKTATTIFITGPRIREWGFWCPKGWRHWRDYTSGENGEKLGRGCD